MENKQTRSGLCFFSPSIIPRMLLRVIFRSIPLAAIMSVAEKIISESFKKYGIAGRRGLKCVSGIAGNAAIPCLLAGAAGQEKRWGEVNTLYPIQFADFSLTHEYQNWYYT